MAGEKYNMGIVPELGSLVVVRLNFCDEEGNVVEEKQHQGRIVKITDQEVIIKHPTTGEEVSLPPYFGSYERPRKGEYKLASTGETVVDPDYVTEWTLRASSPQSN